MHTNAHRAPALRTLLAALVVLGASACSSEPPPACPAPRECALPPACPAVIAFDAATLASPEERLVVEVLQYLFKGDFEQVRALLTPELAQDLVPDKLMKIVRGLVEAHGPPVQIMDVWTTELKEKDERMPAVELLLKMANETRVNLVLVFDPAGVVKGLWLRPI